MCGNTLENSRTGEVQLSNNGQWLIQEMTEQVAVIHSDENFNGSVESLEAAMDVEYGGGGKDGDCGSSVHLTTSQQEHEAAVVSNSEYSCCVERMYRSMSMPRCYCRPSWDPALDLLPYVSDIY
jgi:hypothetical protein